jgi:hypothetical protein
MGVARSMDNALLVIDEVASAGGRQIGHHFGMPASVSASSPTGWHCKEPRNVFHAAH